ncbi:CoA-binding protein [Parapedobacter soli]|uniref:CoA-binding protein n=1 Tax=Parapedobacter soli TaxID=416955 RepID=UPI0021C5F73E|nr:CoA-binding protein [Parapedobacter soli]
MGTEKKKTLILGATTNPARYAYLAAHRLVDAGHEIVNIGIKKGASAGVEIQRAAAALPDIDTITLYIGPPRQPEYYDYIVETRPRRIIFNPGTENPELQALAKEHGIETVQACTLVLLSTGQY